jgi:hypothetical protein
MGARIQTTTIAVFIRDPDAWFDEVVRLANLGTDILMDPVLSSPLNHFEPTRTKMLHH